MSLKSRQSASSGRRRGVSAVLAGVAASLCVCTLAAGATDRQARADRRAQGKLDEANRREGAALLSLADAAMAGRPAASDFGMAWRNDFFKAQPGTFVPFTITIDRGRVTAPTALMYVRAARRGAVSPPRATSESPRFAFDAIFPVELTAPAGQPVRITRGFAVPAGAYDVYVALRERPADPLDVDARSLRAAVLKQPLTVPDFWTGELATSTVMLATRIGTLVSPIDPDDLLEQPYAIGQNEVEIAPDSTFRRDREMIVVFLIYNPTVTVGKQFDVQVDYHVFHRAADAAPDTGTDHPPARTGERYVSHTTPQRFNPASMGARIDPASGQPLLAGQGILLSSFEEGEYRIGIIVTDLLSRKTLSRDVTFTVAGS